MEKISISISPELHSALIRAALDNDTSVSRQIETYLKEHPVIMKYINEIRAEPDTGVYAVNPKRLKQEDSKNLVASS
ncbi:MAG: hypothetical protein HZA82_06195 [Thaumarchaeota archaeon]|nr:hypothetical protein [Nitrososphaerota archaeon]